MDQILAKIVNLSYELLGIFLPGFIFGLFILLCVVGSRGSPTGSHPWSSPFIDARLDRRSRKKARR